MDIKTMIYEIRGQKVMLDSDLAKLYGYETRRLNEMVKNNIDRFPNDFMWKLTKEEEGNLMSKISTSSYTQFEHGGKRKPSNVFTEQGIYALSGILKGPLATAVSINLIRTFKQLKDFYNNNSYLLDKVVDIEIRQNNFNNKLIEHDNKLNEIISSLSTNKETKEVIFFEGQIYDAFSFLADLISKANKEIILIDNYVDIKTLNILAKKKNECKVIIYTSRKHKLLNKLDIDNFNEQYPSLSIKYTETFHDRFIILDKAVLYHIGHSIKDAGKKGFAIIKMQNKEIIKDILEKINCC